MTLPLLTGGDGTVKNETERREDTYADRRAKTQSAVIGGHTFTSRFSLGSGSYALKLIQAAIQYAGAELITMAVCRTNTAAARQIGIKGDTLYGCRGRKKQKQAVLGRLSTDKAKPTCWQRTNGYGRS